MNEQITEVEALRENFKECLGAIDSAPATKLPWYDTYTYLASRPYTQPEGTFLLVVEARKMGKDAKNSAFYVVPLAEEYRHDVKDLIGFPNAQISEIAQKGILAEDAVLSFEIVDDIKDASFVLHDPEKVPPTATGRDSMGLSQAQKAEVDIEVYNHLKEQYKDCLTVMRELAQGRKNKVGEWHKTGTYKNEVRDVTIAVTVEPQPDSFVLICLTAPDTELFNHEHAHERSESGTIALKQVSNDILGEMRVLLKFSSEEINYMLGVRDPESGTGPGQGRWKHRWLMAENVDVVEKTILDSFQKSA